MTVLIAGSDDVLAAHLAARYLARSDDSVVLMWLVGKPDVGWAASVRDMATRIKAGDRAAISDEALHMRLRIVADAAWQQPQGPVLSGSGAIDSVWCLPGGRQAISHHEAQAHAVLSTCLEVAGREVNYVGGRTAEYASLEAAVIRHCEVNQKTCRIFRTPLVADEDCGPTPSAGSDLLCFLTELHQFKVEIEGKAPGYFEFRSLRGRLAADAALDLISADCAAERMLRIAGEEGQSRTAVHEVSGRRMRFADFCEWVGNAYDMALVPAGEPGDLNAVDRLFDQRLSWFWPCVGGRLTATASAAHSRPADVTRPEQERYHRLPEIVYRGQEATRAARDRRVNEMPAGLERRTIDRDGTPFSYFVAGSQGVPVVLLNALGQGLRYWHRLIDCLMPHHRVIVWEPRGTTAPPPPYRLDDHVKDLEAVLRQESIERCHLVGWCTGPKVALRFCLRHPGTVASLVFLNSTFKCTGSPGENTTNYENSLESLCRMVVERPSLAGPLMRALQSTIEQGEIDLEGSDGEKCALNVLSRVNVDLRREILGPFRDEGTTVNYAHQLIDFVSDDVLADASGVNLPMLVISSEYDQVSAPAMSRAAAAVFPHSRYLHVRGASHYCLYDRPELIAGLMEAFFTDEMHLPGTRGEMVEIA